MKLSPLNYQICRQAVVLVFMGALSNPLFAKCAALRMQLSAVSALTREYSEAELMEEERDTQRNIVYFY